MNGVQKHDLAQEDFNAGSDGLFSGYKVEETDSILEIGLLQCAILHNRKGRSAGRPPLVGNADQIWRREVRRRCEKGGG